MTQARRVQARRAVAQRVQARRAVAQRVQARRVVACGALLGLLLGASACGSDDGGPERVNPGLAVGGGPSASASAGSSAAPSAAPASYAAPLPRSEPTGIKIPRLNVSAPMSELGLKPDGTIEEPPLSKPNLAGWWKDGPTPGEGGPSVILGHVDANRHAAVFYRLKELRPGDRVQVTRQDGRTATFAVQSVEQVPKSSFPGQKVYAEDLDYSALRLVTCGGTFDSSTGHYVDNVIAYTRLVTG
ncbi:class F sortase [Actinomadura barringtoniae]|uniref:Class F sortase n=1 Tax=Actinomadura barringtoniae TaxID=1427535 RepID=A0A939TA79_9ACTN|nr:class F sortase [Actinomadura barringtoniae]MBO2448780.1 class F sortase [Actinomadura barringtoniae]